MSSLMIPVPLRHRTACWVVRDVGPGRPRWDATRRAALRLRAAEGLVVTPDGEPLEVYGRVPEHAAVGLDALEDCTGQWVGMLTDEDAGTVAALSDLHGFGHLFTYAHRRGRRQDVYLATTLDALVDRLRAEGAALEVNWPFTLTTLASAHILTRSHWSEETFVSGIRLLRPTQLLVMDASGYELHERAVTTDPQGRSYEELLDAGIERAARLLRSVADAGWSDLRIYSSGGKDSRAVYALLQHAGVLPRVSVSAADPTRWAQARGRAGLWSDLAVSDSLRRHFGLPWSVEPEYEDRMLSWAQSLQLHQSYAAGDNWSFDAARQLRWPVEPHAAIRGAAGETLRSGHRAIIAPRSWTRSTGRKRATLGQDLDTLATMLLHPEVHLPSPVAAAGRDLVARSFAPLPSAAINEQLNQHYLLHRNRSHFGHVLQSLDTRALQVFPLATPELLRAAYHLPYWERHRGTAVFDLIERVAPELNRMAFEGSSWPQEVWQKRDPSFAPPPSPAGPFSREQYPDYFAQEDQNHARRGRWSGPHRFETRAHAHRMNVEGLWRMHDLVADASVLPTRTVEDLTRLVGLGSLPGPVTAAKLASLLRALDSPVEPEPLAAEVRVGRRGVLGRWAGRGRGDEPGSVHRPGGVRTHADLVAARPGAGLVPSAADPATPLVLTCHAWVEGSRVRARRVGRLPDGAALRHTFTLVRGTEHLGQVRTDDREATVAEDLAPGSYRVLMTAQQADRPEVAYRLFSMPVTVTAEAAAAATSSD